MSFIVAHMEKIDRKALKGIQIHNQRERDSNTNFDIDKSKSCLNYDLKNPIKVNYNDLVKKRISELNLKRAVRSDAVLVCSWNLGSDKDFFLKLDELEQKRFFEESYNFFKNRYGEENVVSAVVHLDERTPHMHFCHVPVTKDGRLSCKSLYNKTELRNVQTDYTEYMRDCGFDLQRGDSLLEKRKHMKENEYKIYKSKIELEELEQRKESLIQENENLENQNKQMNEDLKKAKDNFNTEFKAIQSVTAQISKIKHNLDVGYKNTISNLKIVSSPKLDVNKMNIKKSLIGKKIILDKDDFDSMVDMIEFCNANKHKIDNFDNLLENYKGIEKDLRVNVKEKMQSFQKEEKIKQLESDLVFRDKINNFLFEQIKIHNLEDEVKKAIEEKFKNQTVQKIGGMEL